MTEEELEAFVISLVQKHKDPEKSTPKRWAWGIAAFLVFVLAMAALSIFLWKRGRRLAKLEHERDVAKREAINAEVAHQVEEREDKRSQLAAEADLKRGRVQEIEAEIVEAREEYDKVTERIDSISSWDDVDRYIGR